MVNQTHPRNQVACNAICILLEGGILGPAYKEVGDPR